MFLRGTEHYPLSWLLIEIGVRKAQDKGIHRKKTYSHVLPAEGELWKRAWWHLVAFDRITSTSLGRSPCTRDEEYVITLLSFRLFWPCSHAYFLSFDVDLPLEVDDEYWEHPDINLAFRQPTGKPSLVTAFNSWIRLTQITAFAVRTLVWCIICYVLWIPISRVQYSIDKSQGLLHLLGAKWRSRMIDKMNAALAQWYDTVPNHRKISPFKPDFNSSITYGICSSMVTDNGKSSLC